MQAGANGMFQPPNPYGSDGRVKVYGYDLYYDNRVKSQFRGALLAHELGHALFGLIERS